MNNISKKILGITLSTATVLSSLTPLSVLADDAYTVSFSFEDGYTAAANGHEIFVYAPEDTNKENPNIAVLREDTTDKGTANCASEVSCTITVSDGAPTKLYLGGTPLYEGDNNYDWNQTITGNKSLTVKNASNQPQQQGYTVHFDGEANNNRVDVALGSTTVQIEVSGKNIPGDRTINLESTDTIILHNFNSQTMEARIFEGTENGFQMMLNVDENNETHIVNPNGGIPGDIHFEVRLKDNSNNNNDPQQPEQPQQPQQPGTGDHFDGKAYILWSCKSGGICMKHFDNIPNFDDGNSTFYKDTTIVDDRTGETFDVDAKYKGWSTDQLFNDWVDAYKLAKGITGDIDWSKVDPKDMLGDPIDVRPYETLSGCTKEGKAQEEYEACVNEFAAQQGVLVARAQLKPVGEPQVQNAYVSYGDRNFKTVIYNSKYKGISIGDLTDLNYYPAVWANPYLRRDQYDISETTKANPTGITTVLLEKIVNIKEVDVNGFEIAKIEALDVPTDAVSIEKVNGEWRLTFSSNYYDNVVFKVTDTKGEVTYFQINRTTVDAWINNVNGTPHLYAEMWFDKNKSYTDFNLTAKIEYKDGTTEKVKLTPHNEIDDGLGNITKGVYEVDESNPEDPHVPRGKGLKKSVFIYKLKDGKTDRDVKNAYINVEYKGSTAEKYAGAFAGSGKGILANIYQGEEK